jgi:leucyl aminopeptidase
MSLPKLKLVSLEFASTWNDAQADLCVVIAEEGDFSEGRVSSPALAKLDADVGLVISELASLKDFEGKWLQAAATLSPSKTLAKRVLCLGAGKKTDRSPARARQIGVRIGEEVAKMGAGKVSKVVVNGSSRLFTDVDLAAQMAVGVRMGTYKYPSLNPSDDAKKDLETPAVVTFAHASASDAFRKANILAESIDACRLLQDGPPNIVTPKYVAENMSERAKAAGLKVEVFGAQKLRQMGFNAMMAVGGGSANEPQLVVVEYVPEKYTKTIAFVGKGLTMDTGGYSLKPAASMVGMKYDMSGSAITLSSVLAIAELKLPVRVIAIGALAENMIDAHAYRVGDILKTLSGKTIEVLNTDAEGRIVLADALHYAAKTYSPDYMFEYSTLTGAMVISLGHVAAGVFPFHHDGIGALVQKASDATGEGVWLLPTFEEYGDDVKGTLADLNNIQNTAGSAGSATAAQFLKEFVDGKPFAHIDIAGVADANQAIGYPRKMSSGYGIQLSVEIARLVADEK